MRKMASSHDHVILRACTPTLVPRVDPDCCFFFKASQVPSLIPFAAVSCSVNPALNQSMQVLPQAKGIISSRIDTGPKLGHQGVRSFQGVMRKKVLNGPIRWTESQPILRPDGGMETGNLELLQPVCTMREADIKEGTEEEQIIPGPR